MAEEDAYLTVGELADLAGASASSVRIAFDNDEVTGRRLPRTSERLIDRESGLQWAECWRNDHPRARVLDAAPTGGTEGIGEEEAGQTPATSHEYSDGSEEQRAKSVARPARAVDWGGGSIALDLDHVGEGLAIENTGLQTAVDQLLDLLVRQAELNLGSVQTLRNIYRTVDGSRPSGTLARLLRGLENQAEAPARSDSASQKNVEPPDG